MASNTPREPANQAVYQSTTQNYNEVRALKFTIQFLKDQSKELQQELTTALDDNLKIHKENLTMRQENIKMHQDSLRGLDEALRKIGLTDLV